MKTRVSPWQHYNDRGEIEEMSFQPNGNRCSVECEQYGLGGPGACKITGRFAMGLDCLNPPLCGPWADDGEDRRSLAADDFATQLSRIEGAIRMAGASPGCTYEPTDSEHALLACAHDILAALNELMGSEQ